MLKHYQHTCRIPCGKKRHQIGFGRITSVDMLQVQVSLLGKYQVVLLSFKHLSTVWGMGYCLT